MDEKSSLVLASVVDPRFKQLKFLSESDTSAVKETLLKHMKAFHEVEVVPKPRKTALDTLLGPEKDTAHDDTSPKAEMERDFTEPKLPRKDSPLI